MAKFEYIPDHTGNPPSSSYKVVERPIYESSRVGMNVTEIELISAPALSDEEGQRTLGNKQYALSNHLGNVLVVINDIKRAMINNNTIEYYTAQVVSATDYSPFGVGLEGRTFSSEEYRYGFNGKEKDDEGMGGGAQTYDYGFRIYNTSLAKFLSVDPLLSKFAMLTPYQYASNTPIAAIDLDGLEARIITYEWCIGENVVSTHVELTIDIVIINNSSQSQSDVMGLYSDLKPMLDASFSGEQFDRAILNITYLGPADAEKLYVQASNDHKKVIYVEIRDSWNETDKARISKAGQAPESTPG